MGVSDIRLQLILDRKNPQSIRLKREDTLGILFRLKYFDTSTLSFVEKDAILA